MRKDKEFSEEVSREINMYGNQKVLEKLFKIENNNFEPPKLLDNKIKNYASSQESKNSSLSFIPWFIPFALAALFIVFIKINMPEKNISMPRVKIVNLEHTSAQEIKSKLQLKWEDEDLDRDLLELGLEIVLEKRTEEEFDVIPSSDFQKDQGSISYKQKTKKV